MAETVQPGTLYLVATPIGNLNDLSPRALALLSGVDAIAAEDTRSTGILLSRLLIKKPLISYYSHNERRRIPNLLEQLREGRSIALVTDAGTPGVSDPASLLVRAAVEAGLPVIAIPGPSAFLLALIVSGFNMDRFVFEGFLPLKKGRKTRIEALKNETRTVALYESPHRIVRLLEELRDSLGERRLSVSRELTKKFEETLRGTPSELLKHFSAKEPRGEFTVVIAGAEEKARNAYSVEEADES